tara:strand:- start:710 stop:1090 length:381 start_codon:yes stop_codon:yes gene_type:complete
MNQLVLIVVVIAAFVFFGGSNVPNVLKQNKQMILGFAAGLVFCSFMGLRFEGMTDKEYELMKKKVKNKAKERKDLGEPVTPQDDPKDRMKPKNGRPAAAYSSDEGDKLVDVQEAFQGKKYPKPTTN